MKSQGYLLENQPRATCSRTNPGLSAQGQNQCHKVMSVPGLLPRPMSGFPTLLQHLSVLMSLAPVPPRTEKIRLHELVPSLSDYNTRESEHSRLPAAALRKMGPAACLGSTVELTLLTGALATEPKT